MKKASLILLLLSCAYGTVQQMVVADTKTNAAAINSPVPANGAQNSENNNDNSILALASQAKDDLPPELKSSLLRDLQHKPSPVATSAKPDLKTPHVSNSAVLAWANEAMVATFSYDFINIDRNRQAISNYYTPGGWNIMTGVHNEIGDEAAVIKEQLVASAVAVYPPKIIEQKSLENNYSWLVEMPLLLTLSKTGHVKSSKVLARLLVIRDNPQVHDRGLAINNISLKKIA